MRGVFSLPCGAVSYELLASSGRQTFSLRSLGFLAEVAPVDPKSLKFYEMDSAPKKKWRFFWRFFGEAFFSSYFQTRQRRRYHQVLAAKDTPLAVRNALLERHQIMKCKVRTTSALIGRTATEIGFREKYKAAIIAVQRGGEDQRVASRGRLANVVFEAGDILMLHCLDKCPLLQFKEPALSPTPMSKPRDSQQQRMKEEWQQRMKEETQRQRTGGGAGGGGEGRGEGGGVGDASAPPPDPNVDTDTATSTHVSLEGVRFKSRPSAHLSAGENFSVKSPPSQTSSAVAHSLMSSSSPSRPASASASNLVKMASIKSAVRHVSSMLNLGLKDGGGGGGGGGWSAAGGSEKKNVAGADASSSSSSHPSRPQTLGVTPDPDLEVLSREGAQDMRAMTDFTCPVRVLPEGAMDGKTLAAAGLRGLPGLFLTAVQAGCSTGAAAARRERKEEGEEEKEAAAEAMAAPGPDYVLKGGDVLWFAGDAAGVHSLRRIPGLAPQTTQVDKLHMHKSDRRLVQAVIAVRSPLIGQTVRDSHFRTRYDAVIIAVQRSGGRIQAKIGDIALQAGDVLLLDTGSSFLQLYRANPAFALVSEIENSAPPQFDKLLPACGTAALMIAVFVAGAMDLFVAALLASGVMLSTGCLTQDAARAAVKWDVITTIAAAFGVSAAMEQSGVAGAVATTLVRGGQSLGTGAPGVLIAVYVATFFLCNVVGNNAAAALMYPIAAGAADQQGIDRDQMSFLLMLAASASFMSPFGYQTNLMVYGPGGYVFADFLRFGMPMQLVQMVVSVSVVLLDGLW